MSEPSCVVVMTTLPVTEDAEALAAALVGARLAACVQIGAPMMSVYAWDGALQRDEERPLLIKTSRPRVAALWTELRSRHPYEVPEFVVLPVEDGNPAYLQWVMEQTGAGRSQGTSAQGSAP